MKAYRESIKIAKETGTPRQKAEKKSAEKTDFRTGRLSDEDIRSGGHYTLYTVKDANDSNEKERGHYTYDQLVKLIDNDVIDYDARRKLWVGKKGTYVLRKREK